MKHIRHFVLMAVALLWTFSQTITASNVAAQGFGLLRDAETELFLRTISDPIFIAAGLNPDSVSMYIVNDRELNAFVAGGQNVFINTGMILRTENVDQLIGVIAHETGHIAGAHLRRRDEIMGGASAISIMALLLSAAAIAAGSGDAGMGIFMGGQTMAQRTALGYSREQESRADQAGIAYMDKAGLSARGALEMFEILGEGELMSRAYQNEYLRSHPLSRDRIIALRTNAEKSPNYSKPPNPVHNAWFKRIQAKLAGYTNPPSATLRDFPPSDQSVPARYARVYAYQKGLQFDKAFGEIESLLSEVPNDPYYNEIAGQILLENSRIEESITYYRRANELLPRNSLIITALAQGLIALDERNLDKEAMAELEQVVVMDPINDTAWRQLGILYARNDKQAEASLATAELFNLYGRYPDALYHANIASEEFAIGSPKWIRAQDLIAVLTVEVEKLSREQRRRR